MSTKSFPRYLKDEVADEEGPLNILLLVGSCNKVVVVLLNSHVPNYQIEIDPEHVVCHKPQEY